jgi:hypothetical protein
MKKNLVITISVLFFFNISLKAQIPDKAKYLESIFIYNFMLKIQWPDAYRSGDFIIGVIGETTLRPELDKLAEARKMDNRNIVVTKYNSAEDMNFPHLLFIPASPNAEKYLEICVKKIGHRQGTLIVTEQEGILSKGSVINFIVRDKKIRFEISDEISERYGFKISALKKFLTE